MLQRDSTHRRGSTTAGCSTISPCMTSHSHRRRRNRCNKRIWAHHSRRCHSNTKRHSRSHTSLCQRNRYNNHKGSEATTCHSKNRDDMVEIRNSTAETIIRHLPKLLGMAHPKTLAEQNMVRVLSVELKRLKNAYENGRNENK